MYFDSLKENFSRLFYLLSRPALWVGVLCEENPKEPIKFNWATGPDRLKDGYFAATIKSATGWHSQFLQCFPPNLYLIGGWDAHWENMECHCGLGEFGICRNFGKLGWVMSCYLLILSWCLSYHKGYTKKTFQNPNVILYCVLVEINFLDMPTTRACTLRPQLHSDASTLLFLHSKYCSCIGMYKPSWILLFDNQTFWDASDW